MLFAPSTDNVTLTLSRALIPSAVNSCLPSFFLPQRYSQPPLHTQLLAADPLATGLSSQPI